MKLGRAVSWNWIRVFKGSKLFVCFYAYIIIRIIFLKKKKFAIVERHFWTALDALGRRFYLSINLYMKLTEHERARWYFFLLLSNQSYFTVFIQLLVLLIAMIKYCLSSITGHRHNKSSFIIRIFGWMSFLFSLPLDIMFYFFENLIKMLKNQT